MSANASHIRLGIRRSIRGEAVLLAAILAAGVLAGVGIDRAWLGSRTTVTTPAVVMLPTSGWASGGAKLRAEINDAMNAVLRSAAHDEWSTTSAELRMRVNEAMNELRPPGSA